MILFSQGSPRPGCCDAARAGCHGGVIWAAVGNDYYVRLARVGAFYELFEKAPDYSALIVRGNHDCRHDTAL